MYLTPSQCVALGVTVWVIGGNAVCMLHHLRMGKSIWSSVRRPDFPFPNFNLQEWILLTVVAASTALCFVKAGNPG